MKEYYNITLPPDVKEAIEELLAKPAPETGISTQMRKKWKEGRCRTVVKLNWAARAGYEINISFRKKSAEKSQ